MLGKPATPAPNPGNTGGKPIDNPTPGEGNTGKPIDGATPGGGNTGKPIEDTKPGGAGGAGGGYGAGGVPVIDPVVISAPGHPPHDPNKDPTIGSYAGATPETVDRINDVLAGGTWTTTGTGSRNVTLPSGTSIQDDFDYLSQGGTPLPQVSTPRGPLDRTRLPDGSMVIMRPSRTGPATIEIQRPTGGRVVEIRYD